MPQTPIGVPKSAYEDGGMGAGYDRTGDSGLGTRLAHRSGGGREGGDSAQRLRRRTGRRRPSRLRSVRCRIARTEAAACTPFLDGQAFVAVSRVTWISTAQATAECQVVGEFLRVVATRPSRIRGVGGAKYPNGSCDLPLTGVSAEGSPERNYRSTSCGGAFFQNHRSSAETS